jgi:hypothetical protein
MNDYIVFERIWQDMFYFKILVTCKSDYVTAQMGIYTSNMDIEKLCEKLDLFIYKEINDVYWINGEVGDYSTPCISLRLEKNKLGHVRIEVYMEIEDGGALSRHNCCFFINTELGLLEQFRKSLPEIKNPEIGKKVILNEYHSPNGHMDSFPYRKI